MVWAKCAWGTWGLGPTFGDKLYFTWDIPEEKWIPNKLVAPIVAKPAPKHGKQLAANPAASSSIPVSDGEQVQHFKTLWDLKMFYAIPVRLFGSRGSQITDGWMRSIENFVCLHCGPHTISISAPIQKPLATNGKPFTSHELCTVWADKSMVCGGVHQWGGGGGC